MPTLTKADIDRALGTLKHAPSFSGSQSNPIILSRRTPLLYAEHLARMGFAFRFTRILPNKEKPRQ